MILRPRRLNCKALGVSCYRSGVPGLRCRRVHLLDRFLTTAKDRRVDALLNVYQGGLCSGPGLGPAVTHRMPPRWHETSTRRRSGPGNGVRSGDHAPGNLLDVAEDSGFRRRRATSCNDEARSGQRYAVRYAPERRSGTCVPKATEVVDCRKSEERAGERRHLGRSLCSPPDGRVLVQSVPRRRAAGHVAVIGFQYLVATETAPRQPRWSAGLCALALELGRRQCPESRRAEVARTLVRIQSRQMDDEEGR